MKMSRLWIVVASVGGLYLSGHAAVVAGDAAEGKKKYYTCGGCHSIPGYDNSYPSVYPVPKLGGQHAEYIVSALKAYQNGERKHGSMQGNAAGWTEQDVQDIAAYVSRFRSINESNAITGNAAAGKSKAESCASCHGEDGNSENASFPRLAAQYEGYLVKALQDYKRGVRKSPMMSGFAATLSEQDMKDIAAHYASQKKGLNVVRD